MDDMRAKLSQRGDPALSVILAPRNDERIPKVEKDDDGHQDTILRGVQRTNLLTGYGTTRDRTESILAADYLQS
jgi:hypothetical protein